MQMSLSASSEPSILKIADFVGFFFAQVGQRALVVAREYLDELAAASIPVIEQEAGTGAACVLEVTLDQALQDHFIRLRHAAAG